MAIGCCGYRLLWLSVIGCCWSWLSVIVVVGQCQSWLSWLVIPMTAVVRLPVVSTVPSMAKGTTGIEPAGGAEKAPTV